MMPIATCTVLGSFEADENMIDENNGYFRVVTGSFKDISTLGSFENENGDSIEYCSPDGIPTQPAMPNLDTDNALYVLDRNLKQVGSIANLTSEWVNSVQFNKNICTIKTNDQTISVDLSNPAEPKALKE